jgi:hypothetical protein
MKGLAPPDTLTGKVQRALTDDWQTQAEIVGACAPLSDTEYSNVRPLLERLVREGRAQQSIVHSTWAMSGGYPVYRRNA